MTQVVVAGSQGQPTPCLLPELEPNSNDSDLLKVAGSVFVHDRSRGRARILAMSHGWVKVTEKETR